MKQITLWTILKPLWVIPFGLVFMAVWLVFMIPYCVCNGINPADPVLWLEDKLNKEEK